MYVFSRDDLNLRTTFEETVGTSEYPELSENQKIWMVALPAIIMSSNKSSLNTLEVDPLNSDSREKWLNVLSRDWGISSREDLLETISDMEYSGHDDTFLSIRNIMGKYENLPVDEILLLNSRRSFQWP